MEVRLQPEKEAQLAQIAAQRGRNADELAGQVLSRHPEDDKHFIEAVNIGLAAAERGDFVEHEEVGSRLGVVVSQVGHGLGTEISVLFAEDSIDREIPELRGHPITPPSSK
jgi:predicted transcriptional regulator